MFGDYMTAFGLQFPFQGADPQAGLFGENSPNVPPVAGVGSPAATGEGSAATAPGMTPAPTGSPVAGIGGKAPAPTAPSPLASPMAPGQAPQAMQPTTSPDQTNPAPAAGVNSQFGKETI